MSLILIAFSAYLTYYTFTYGLQVWKKSKFSGMPILIISVSFIPLAVWAEYFK